MAMTETFKLPQKGPMAVIAAIVAQTAAGLMWVGAAEERLAQVERQIEVQAPSPERLARVEEHVAAIGRQLQRIETKVDALGPG